MEGQFGRRRVGRRTGRVVGRDSLGGAGADRRLHEYRAAPQHDWTRGPSLLRGKFRRLGTGQLRAPGLADQLASPSGRRPISHSHSRPRRKRDSSLSRSGRAAGQRGLGFALWFRDASGTGSVRLPGGAPYLRVPANSGCGSGPGSSGIWEARSSASTESLGRIQFQPGGPVGLAEQHHDRGDDGHADEDGVDQDPAGQADAELLDRVRGSRPR